MIIDHNCKKNLIGISFAFQKDKHIFFAHFTTDKYSNILLTKSSIKKVAVHTKF